MKALGFAALDPYSLEAPKPFNPPAPEAYSFHFALMRKASPRTFVCSLPVRRCYGHGYGSPLSAMASGGEGMGCEGVLDQGGQRHEEAQHEANIGQDEQKRGQSSRVRRKSGWPYRCRVMFFSNPRKNIGVGFRV